MKERPILFSAPMIRAILDGRKNMTRRAVKDPLAKNGGQYCVECADDDPNYLIHVHDPECVGYCDYSCHYPCPFGQPGDRLWVRETFAVVDGKCTYRASMVGDPWDAIRRKAITWRPSIHMPRHASRITLLVTAVRVERLQEISEEDAVAEGAPPYINGNPDCGVLADGGGIQSAVGWFASLWQSLNAKRPGCSWEDNPWCWVVEFETVKEGAA